jgi:hypothetical protein
MTFTFRRALALVALAALAACGGGSSPPPPQPPRISWNANHENGVNSAGGGYWVTVDARSIDVPYVSGAFTPNWVTTTLSRGTHVVSVSAYQLLDPNGGNSGQTSAAETITVIVP